MKPSERYQQDAKVLFEFRNAYVDLLNATERYEPGFGLPELVPRVSDAEWNRLRSNVAITAGAALSAYNRVYGGLFNLRNAAYVTNNVHPINNWDVSLHRPDELRPDMIIAAVEAAIGRAQKNSQDAAKREHGLIGTLAAFLRWPSELREAVGPGHAAQRRAAGAVGVAVQIFVGVIVSLVTAGLLALIVLAWKAVL